MGCLFLDCECSSSHCWNGSEWSNRYVSLLWRVFLLFFPTSQHKVIKKYQRKVFIGFALFRNKLKTISWWLLFRWLMSPSDCGRPQVFWQLRSSPGNHRYLLNLFFRKVDIRFYGDILRSCSQDLISPKNSFYEKEQSQKTCHRFD